MSRRDRPCSHFAASVPGLSRRGDLGGESWGWALGSVMVAAVPFLGRCCS